MPDGLTVDLQGLEDLAGQLDSIRATMSDASTWMREFDGDLGEAEMGFYTAISVDKSIDGFESNWRDGRSQVDKNCERLVKMVRQAVNCLRTTDEELTKQLRENGGNEQ